MLCIRAIVASSNDLRFAGNDSSEEQQQCSPKKRHGEIQLKNAFQQACECSIVTDEEAEGAQCLRFVSHIERNIVKWNRILL